MANKFVTFFDVDGARKNGWSEASIRDMLSRIERLNSGEPAPEPESESEEEAVDIALLPDNSPLVPLDVLYARREQLDDLYYTYGDESVFNKICNITGIINAREEEENHENF